MSEIPVNTRVVGEPKGEEILYFEDYVYTFMKRILEKCRRQDCEVAFYGTKTYRNGAEVYIISGAIQIQKEQTKQDYFAAHTFLGKGFLERGIKNDICVNLTTEGKKKIQKEDFYIYYAQNEEMQNYMVGWNQEQQGIKNRVENNDSVRYSRMVQNYNKEEVKISFLWNMMNVLGLSFIVCVMVYAIVSMNHYYKMKEMEDNLAYVISVMSDSVHTQGINTEKEQMDKTIADESVLEEKQQKENNGSEEEVVVSVEEEDSQEATTIDEAEKQEDALTMAEEQIYIQILDEQETQQTIDGESGEDDLTTPVSSGQVYIVRDGDTLRSIAFAHYGSYDMVDAICIENGITDSDSILSGQKLLLP